MKGRTAKWCWRLTFYNGEIMLTLQRYFQTSNFCSRDWNFVEQFVRTVTHALMLVRVPVTEWQHVSRDVIVNRTSLTLPRVMHDILYDYFKVRGNILRVYYAVQKSPFQPCSVPKSLFPFPLWSIPSRTGQWDSMIESGLISFSVKIIDLESSPLIDHLLGVMTVF